MKSATLPATPPLDSLPEPHHEPTGLGLVRETRDRLSLTFPEPKSPDEIWEILLSEVYDYMKRNFHLSKDELPQDEISAMVNAYQTGTTEDYFPRVIDGLTHDLNGRIMTISKDSQIIPPIALNSIFLKPETGRLLLKKAIKNYISSHPGWFPLSDKRLEIIADHLFKMISESCENEKSLDEDLLFANNTIRENNDEPRQKEIKEKCKVIRPNRKNAVKEMKLIKWPYEDNELALTDEFMEQFFERRDGLATSTPFENEFLTTYFDSAQFGLSNHLLSAAVVKLVNEKMMNEFESLVRKFRRRISEYVIGRPHDNALFLTQSGTESAQLLFDKWAKKDGLVLAVNQEYEGILEYLEEDIGTDVVRLKETMKDPDYADSIRRHIIADKPDIVLISDISRFGTIFPFDNKALKDLFMDQDRKYKLVVDVCQSIGRKIINYHDFLVDAVIGSPHKGSEIIEPAGLIAAQPHLAEDLFARLKDRKLRGTANVQCLGRVGVACCPDLLGPISVQHSKEHNRFKKLIALILGGSSGELDIDDEQIKKMTASIPERDKAIKNLSHKFLYMVDCINQKNNGRIEILNPPIHKYNRSYVQYNDDGTVDTSQLGGIFELKINGVSSEQIERVADEYGVTINDYTGGYEKIINAGTPEETKEKLSIRIAFHPFMNDNAIKILGYVLMKCCEKYPF